MAPSLGSSVQEKRPGRQRTNLHKNEQEDGETKCNNLSRIARVDTRIIRLGPRTEMTPGMGRARRTKGKQKQWKGRQKAEAKEGGELEEGRGRAWKWRKESGDKFGYKKKKRN